MRSDVLKSEIKIVEASTAEDLTKKINEELDDEWKLLLSSYQVCADAKGQRFYSTLMTKERYYADPEILEEQHDAPSSLDPYAGGNRD